jgi:hypothetical protein
LHRSGAIDYEAKIDRWPTIREIFCGANIEQDIVHLRFVQLEDGIATLLNVAAEWRRCEQLLFSLRQLLIVSSTCSGVNECFVGLTDIKEEFGITSGDIFIRV